MGEDSLKTRSNRGFRNRTQMTRRRRSVAECEVTLRADKRCALISLIDLVVENSTVIQSRRNMTAFSAAARLHRNTHVRDIGRHWLVTLRTFHLSMDFMSKGAC